MNEKYLPAETNELCTNISALYTLKCFFFSFYKLSNDDDDDDGVHFTICFICFPFAIAPIIIVGFFFHFLSLIRSVGLKHPNEENTENPFADWRHKRSYT